MKQRSVISYIYSGSDSGVPSDFRIHEDVDVTSAETVADRIISDRGELPTDHTLYWY